MAVLKRNLIFCLAAILTGLISIAFGLGVTQASRAFALLTAGRLWLALLLCPAGFALIVYLTRRVFPGAQGSGIPQAMAGLQMQDGADIDRVLSLRIAAGKFLLTLLGFAVGASIGKEGPTVQIGCAVMNVCGRLGMARSQALQRLLILAGGAAGITCAFNAPIAGVVFAIEEMAASFDRREVRSIVLAAVASGATLFLALGYHPYFGHAAASMTADAVWLAIPLCALVAGAAGGMFASVLMAPGRFMPASINRLATARPVMFAALSGLALAVIGLWSHGQAFDASYGTARAALTQGILPPLAFAPLKFLATLVSYLSGIPGGIFAPSLAIGVGIGTGLAHLIPALPTSAFAMIGMAAYFAGVVQAPLTATIIVIEMTGNPAMTVPIGLAAILGTLASRIVCREPLYHALARQFLRVVEHKPVAEPNAVGPAPDQ